MEYYLTLCSTAGTSITSPLTGGTNTILRYNIHQMSQNIASAYGECCCIIECVGVFMPAISGSGSLSGTPSYAFTIRGGYIKNYMNRVSTLTEGNAILISANQGIFQKYQTGLSTTYKPKLYIDNIINLNEIIIQIIAGTQLLAIGSTQTLNSTYSLMLKITPIIS